MKIAVLHELIEQASTLVDTLFDPNGQMFAHILAISADGRRILMTCPMVNAEEETMFRMQTPQLLRVAGFQRWCFFSEAWSAEYRTDADPQRQLPADRPDRMEVVTFAAEQQGTSEVLVAVRQIYRSPDAPARLMPLVFRQQSKFVVAEQHRKARGDR